MQEENMQSVLFRKKRQEQREVVRALGTVNDFDTDDGSEDEETKKMYDLKLAKT